MQDRLKFRVWDKENKCLHYPTRYSNFTIVNGTVVKIESYPIANSAYLGKRISWEFDYAVIMQCTGLKDKNGKLIYEGDVVNGTCGVYWGKMIVKFNENEAKFYMYRIDKRYTDLHFHGKNQEDNFELEVIGNIYENTELLEVEDE